MNRILSASAAGTAVLCLGATCPAGFSQEVPLAGAQAAAFPANCGNANVQVIFDGSKLDKGLYGVTKWAAVGDPDLILIGTQWWMFFAAGPGPGRPVEYFAAYLPPGASLETSTTFPSDPKGWHILGAQADGQGHAVPVIPSPPAGGWDAAGAETATVTRGPGGEIVFYYSGYSESPYTGHAMKLGMLRGIKDGTGTPAPENPIMSAIGEWENYPKGVGELLEPAVRYVPATKKWVMIYTAGAWWGKPPNNELSYADSADGIHWEHRKPLGFGSPYYNADWLYNPLSKRYEMTVAKEPKMLGGGAPRDIVWLSATRPDALKAGWTGEVTLLQYNLPGGAQFYNRGALSPAMQYGNLPGEKHRLFVYFHSYSAAGSQSIGRFYCDAQP